MAWSWILSLARECHRSNCGTEVGLRAGVVPCGVGQTSNTALQTPLHWGEHEVRALRLPPGESLDRRYRLFVLWSSGCPDNFLLGPLLLGHPRTGFDFGISSRFRRVVTLVLDRAASPFVRCVTGMVGASGVGARICAGGAAVRPLSAVLWDHGWRGHVGEVR
jgi:hypothetical protein